MKRDVVGIDAEPSETGPPRLLDLQQVAEKFESDRKQTTETTGQPGFPSPAGYFRGRLLWDEAAVEGWQQAASKPALGEAV
jgi:hypothetical protein